MTSIWDQLGLSDSPFVLIEETLAAPAGFLLYHAVKRSLKEGCKVVLLSVNESLAHYQHVLRKLGVSLQQSIDRGQVVFLDCLDSQLLEGGLSSLLRTVTDSCCQRSPAGKVCLVIDELNVLRWTSSSSEQAWLVFLLQLMSLLKMQGEMVIRVSNDVDSDGLWIRFLEHHAQIVVKTEELESGRSSEVTGQVLVHQREVKLELEGLHHGPALSPHHRHLYKLSDTGVKLVD